MSESKKFKNPIEITTDEDLVTFLETRATNINLSPSIEKIRVREKIRQDNRKYNLNEQDGLALGQLYTTFLQNDRQIRIVRGEETGYQLNTLDTDQENVVVSKNLWSVLLNEFDIVGQLNKGQQVRKSPDPLFTKTAAFGLYIIDTLVTDQEKTMKSLTFAPISQMKRNIDDFKKLIYRMSF